MTRIPAVSPGEAGPLIKLSYWYAKRRFGEVREPFAVAANHRKLFFASGRADLPDRARNMRSRTYSALGITEQGFSSGDACRVPWARETTTAT